MRTRWVGVHSCSSNRSILNTNTHDITDFLGSFGCIIGEIFNIDTCIRLFMKFKTILWVFRKQISYLLVVYFEVWGTDQELSLVWVAFDALKDIFESTRHNTLVIFVTLDSSHSVCFTSTSLTISENSSIVTFQHIWNYTCCCVIIDFNLRSALIITNVKCELFGWFIHLWFTHKNFTF